MDLSEFTKPSITHDQPQKRALIIVQNDGDLRKASDALKERYEREGFEVREQFLEVDEPEIKELEIKEPERKKPKKMKAKSSGNEILRENLTWLQEAKNTVLSIHHHGLDPEIEEETNVIFKGENTALMLADHGLNKADLGGMIIEYVPCYGAKQQGRIFYNTLHEQGAGNFNGNAKTGISSIITKVGKTYHKRELDEKIANLSDKVRRYEERVKDITQKPHINKNTNIPIDDATLKKYQKTKKILLHLQHNYEHVQRTHKRGDSLHGEIADDEFKTRIHKPPRKLNSEGLFEHTTFYLAPPKTETSIVQETQDPKQLANFLKGKQSEKTENTPKKSTGRTV